MEASTDTATATAIDTAATNETRLARVETILAQFDKEPPPLPAEDEIRARLAAIEGRLDAHDRFNMSRDRDADVMSQLSHRVATLESAAGTLVVERDELHESATRIQAMKCSKCGAGSRRTISTSVTTSDESPCGVCGGVSKVIMELAANIEHTERAEAAAIETERVAAEAAATEPTT